MISLIGKMGITFFVNEHSDGRRAMKLSQLAQTNPYENVNIATTGELSQFVGNPITSSLFSCAIAHPQSERRYSFHFLHRQGPRRSVSPLHCLIQEW